MADANSGASDSGLKREGANTAQQSGSSAVEENLQELEAFLDDFEKDLEARAKASATVPAPASPIPPAEEPALLADDELHLSGQAAAAQGNPPAFDPEPLPSAPLDVPAFLHSAAPSRPVPPATGGSGRSGFILALVLASTALLVAIGAAWVAAGANQSLREMEVNLGSTASSTAGVTRLEREVRLLNQRLDELASQEEASSGAGDEPRVVEQAAAASLAEASEADGVQPAASAPPAGEPAVAAARAEGAATAESAGPGKATGTAAPWVVYLVSSDEKKRAERQLAQARAAGITSATLTSASVSGKTWYRVTVPGFTSPNDARAFVKKRAAKAGYGSAWISRG